MDAFDISVAVLKSIAAVSGNLHVHNGIFGTTHGGRPLVFLEVGGSSATTHTLVLAAQHAREWAALEFGFRLVEQVADLVSRCANRDSNTGLPDALLRPQTPCNATDTEAFTILMQTRLVIIPCLNPDGVAHTQVDRYWRKNLEPNGDGSAGTDLNRNAYTPHRNEAPRMDVMPSSSTYQGVAPFSAGEMSRLRAWMDVYEVAKGAFDVVLSYHSWGKLILYPPGDRESFNPATETYDTTAFHYKLAEAMSIQMGRIAKAAGLPVSETACDYLPQQAAAQYVAFGDTPDWIWRRPMDHGAVQKASRQIPTFTIELPPASRCAYRNSAGFALGTQHIVPVVLENMRGLWWIMEWATGFKAAHPNAWTLPNASTVDGRVGLDPDALTDSAVSIGGDLSQWTVAQRNRPADFPWGAMTDNSNLFENQRPVPNLFPARHLAVYVDSDLLEKKPQFPA